VRLLLEITAEDYAGNISDPWPYLNVNPLPLRADITANPLSGIVPLEVQFQASVDGGTPPYELFWQFGDGATASGPSALHTYSTPGSYQARLDVSDAAGEASVAAITVHAVPSADLTADFTVTPAAGPGPFELVATATGGVPPYAFAWTFGDGSAGEGQRVTHNYETAGTKAVELTVSDADGNTARAAVEVDVGFPSPLEVTVEADPPAGEPPLSVLLRAAVVNGQPPFVYSWELDTGLPGSTYGNADEIRHSFPAGQFDVVVTVTDSLGAVGNATVNIQAEDLPQCDHLAGTEANIEPGPPLTVVYRVSLQDIQVGDEARMEYFEDGAETPCFFGNQRFSFPFTEIELILSLNALPAGCGLASGSQGRFQLTYNGVLCPESVREVRIP